MASSSSGNIPVGAEVRELTGDTARETSATFKSDVPLEALVPNIAGLQFPTGYELDEGRITDTTIRHVDAARDLLGRNWDLFESARKRLDDEAEDSDSLTSRLRTFLVKWGRTDVEVADLLRPLYQGSLSGQFSMVRRPEGDPAALPEERRRTVLGLDNELDNDTSALFKLSRFAMDDFHWVSDRYNILQNLKRRKLADLATSRKRSAGLARKIGNARIEFGNREKDRIAADEDYSLARGLLEAQMQAVDDAFVERNRILSNPVALCYVRVNDLPMQVSFRRTPLAARPAPGELPVVCEQGSDLPERLQPFLELLADQPMSAFGALKRDLRGLRRTWFRHPPKRPLPDYRQRMWSLPEAFHVLIGAVPVPVETPEPEPGRRVSRAEMGQYLVQHVTLDQLASGARGHLRRKARSLQNDLGQALGCVLQQLTEMPATARFRWSQLAEANRLDTRVPDRWPDFSGLQQQTAVRTLRESLAWLYSQLAEDAPEDSRTAIRTAIRACLLQAVYEDPDDLLRGKVVQFPETWRPGVLITADLSQVPDLLAPLRVYDQGNRLIGEARVIDSRDQQARVEVLRAYGATPEAFSGWTVAGRGS